MRNVPVRVIGRHFLGGKQHEHSERSSQRLNKYLAVHGSYAYVKPIAVKPVLERIEVLFDHITVTVDFQCLKRGADGDCQVVFRQK